MDAAPACLVTVTDDAFAIGTEVLIHSFRKYNPWFRGDVVLITDGLGPSARARLAAQGPFEIVEPHPDIRARTARLASAFPRIRDIYRRFYSIETFRLQGYETVLYVDSDAYVAGDLSELFSRAEPFLAGPDGYTLEDMVAPLLEPALGGQIRGAPRYGRTIERSFNSGVMVARPPVVSLDTWRGLLDCLEDDLDLADTPFTDQLVLNRYFQGRFEQMSARFNYVVSLEAYIRAAEGIGCLDARIVHFTRLKPWNVYAPGDVERYAPQFVKIIDAWRQLLEEARAGSEPPGRWAETLARQHAWLEMGNLDRFVPIGRIE